MALASGLGEPFELSMSAIIRLTARARVPIVQPMEEREPEKPEKTRNRHERREKATKDRRARPWTRSSILPQTAPEHGEPLASTDVKDST